MEDCDVDTWRARLARGLDRVRTGHDPRWRRLGDAGEMGILSGLRWATWLAEIGVALRAVPPEYWALDVGDGGIEVAVVSCPCGDQPAIARHAAPALCTCKRSFFFDGESVWALNPSSTTTTTTTTT